MVLVYLVGTHHLDPKGPERLRKFLDWTRPDGIGIEISSESAMEAEINHTLYSSTAGEFLLKGSLEKEYNKTVTLTLLRIMRTSGYEAWVPLEFKTVNPGTELYFCEEKKDSILAMEKLVETFRNRTDIAVDVSRIDLEEYQRKADAKYDNNSLEEELKEPEVFPFLFTHRDINAERKIREVLRSIEHALVYIGGAAHIFGDYSPNLYDRLRDFNPIRIKLKDVDNF